MIQKIYDITVFLVVWCCGVRGTGGMPLDSGYCQLWKQGIWRRHSMASSTTGVSFKSAVPGRPTNMLRCFISYREIMMWRGRGCISCLFMGSWCQYMYLGITQCKNDNVSEDKTTSCFFGVRKRSDCLVNRTMMREISKWNENEFKSILWASSKFYAISVASRESDVEWFIPTDIVRSGQ